jgi:hypothetical protein
MSVSRKAGNHTIQLIVRIRRFPLRKEKLLASFRILLCFGVFFIMLGSLVENRLNCFWGEISFLIGKECLYLVFVFVFI